LAIPSNYSTIQLAFMITGLLAGALKKVYFILPIILLLGAAQAIAQKAGAPDITFNPLDEGYGKGEGANAAVLTSVVQADGKIIIGGEFGLYNGVPRNNIARLNTDGTLDLSFHHHGMGANNTIHAILQQPDEKLIVVGRFTNIFSKAHNRIARLHKDGSEDQSFNAGIGPNSIISTCALQEDGKIIIGGYFKTYNGIDRKGVARLHPNGTLDEGFVPAIINNDQTVVSAVQKDGKILIGGVYTRTNGTVGNYVLRLNEDGSIDQNHNIQALALQPDGKILIGMRYNHSYANDHSYVSRLNTNGSQDATFIVETSTWGSIHSIVTEEGGKIYTGGNFLTYGNQARTSIARLNTNGSLDNSFKHDLDTHGSIHTIAFQKDGNLVISGNYVSTDAQMPSRVRRISPTGLLDRSFNVSTGYGANSVIAVMHPQADGKLLIGGNFTSYNNVPRGRLALLNEDGILDENFASTFWANASVVNIGTQKGGKIIVSGHFNQVNGSTKNRITRLFPVGDVDVNFNIGSGANNSILAMAIQPDGKILIAGWFTSFDNVPRRYLARLNADGSLDTDFNIGTGTNNVIRSLVLLEDGKIVIGGEFTSYNGAARRYIARLHPDGTLDQEFDSTLNGFVYSIAIQKDNKIIVGGAPALLARLQADGSIDESFTVGKGASGTVTKVFVQQDSKVLVAGVFSFFNDIASNQLVRLHTDGTLDTGFSSGTGVSPMSSIQDIIEQKSNNLIISGGFVQYNGTGRNRIARLYSNTVTSLSLPASQVAGEMKIYPNPNNGSFKVDLPGLQVSGSAFAEVYNLMGKLVHRQNISSNVSTEINLPILPGGSYFIRVHMDNRLLVQPFVLKD
jgi:uncharacterized delta-60 repeat protein